MIFPAVFTMHWRALLLEEVQLHEEFGAVLWCAIIDQQGKDYTSLWGPCVQCDVAGYVIANLNSLFRNPK